MSYRYVPPEEAVPLLLDRTISPVVAWDTEFEKGVPPSKAALEGVSMAGGKPGDFFGTFWHFGGGHDTVPWRYLLERVILPLFRDPDRTLVAHPLKTDMQPFRARGLRDEDVRCALRCTFSQAHIYNENLPKSLKDLAYCLLGVRGVATYNQVQKELKGLEKEGKATVKAILSAAWEYYRAHRATTKTGKPTSARAVNYQGTTTTWGDARKAAKAAGGKLAVEDVGLLAYDGPRASWHDLVDRLPANGVKKTEVEDYLRKRVEPVVLADYDARIRERFGLYGTEDALYALAIDYFFQARIPTEHYPLLELETLICHPVVTEMEERGLKIDVPLLAAINEHMQTAATELRHEVVARWTRGLDPELARDFNPGSHDQIAHILWNVWKQRPPPWALRGGKLKPQFTRKKDGLCKTDQNVLDYLADKGGPHAEDIRLLRELAKLQDMMSDRTVPLLTITQQDPEHRVHASFWPVGASTGRFSSSDPNVENIPRPGSMPTIRIPQGADPERPPPYGLTRVKKPDGSIDRKRWRVGSLRDIFVPPPGYLYVSADLSQVENRLVAFESQDPTLLALFRTWDCATCGQSGEVERAIHACPNCGAPEGKRDKTQPNQPAVEGFCLGRDIHAHTSAMLGWLETKGYGPGRQDAKAVNHATAYGMGPDTMARNYGMDKKECGVALEAWHARHPNVRGVMHRKVEHAIRELGYIEMFDGHIRRFHAARLLLASGNFRHWEWEKILREGVNCLAQGGTAILMKQSMIDIRNEFQDTPHLRHARLVNQVHDELLYEVQEDHADDALKVVNYRMEHNRLTAMLSVPIVAEGAKGKTWGEVH